MTKPAPSLAGAEGTGRRLKRLAKAGPSRHMAPPAPTSASEPWDGRVHDCPEKPCLKLRLHHCTSSWSSWPALPHCPSEHHWGLMCAPGTGVAAHSLLTPPALPSEG